MGADHDDDDVGHRGQGVQHRVERAPQPDGMDARVSDPCGDLRQPLGLPLLGAIGLDQLHTLEALVDARRQPAELCLGGVEVLVNASLVRHICHQQEREDGDGDRARERRP